MNENENMTEEHIEEIPEITDFGEDTVSDGQLKEFIKQLKIQLTIAQLTSQQLATRCGNYSQDTGSKTQAAARAMAEAHNFANRQIVQPTMKFAIGRMKDIAIFSDPNYKWKQEIDMAIQQTTGDTDRG